MIDTSTEAILQRIEGRKMEMLQNVKMGDTVNFLYVLGTNPDTMREGIVKGVNREKRIFTLQQIDGTYRTFKFDGVLDGIIK